MPGAPVKRRFGVGDAIRTVAVKKSRVRAVSLKSLFIQYHHRNHLPVERLYPDGRDIDG
jgi:hypothetical protein